MSANYKLYLKQSANLFGVAGKIKSHLRRVKRTLWLNLCEYFIHFDNKNTYRIELDSLVCHKKPLNSEKETLLIASYLDNNLDQPHFLPAICHELNKQFNIIVIGIGTKNSALVYQNSCDLYIDGSVFINSMLKRISALAFSKFIFLNENSIGRLVEQLIQAYPIKFSLVNFVQSKVVLQKLSEYHIPSILYVQQLFCPEDKLVQAILWAGDTVFSSDISERKAMTAHLKEIVKSIKQLNPMQQANLAEQAMRLIQLTDEQRLRAGQEAQDFTCLAHSELFNEDFFWRPGVDRQTAIRQYIRSWHTLDLRKPAPGFNQRIYSELCKLDAIQEPFSAYIQDGKPQGPWQYEIIKPSIEFKKCEKKLNVAVHVHVFYPDILVIILELLQKNTEQYDLLISTAEKNFKAIKKILERYKFNYQLRVVPNIGRDIGPFLTEFRKELQEYDVIGHLHTKKSLHANNPVFIQSWVDFLFENLLGGQYSMADQIIDAFKRDPRLGLVFPDDPNLHGWGDNKLFAKQLAQELGIVNLPEGTFNFPIGTMFWARSVALKQLFDLHWDWDNYPKEPLPPDGSILHAIERLIPIIVQHHGYKCVATYIPGSKRPSLWQD